MRLIFLMATLSVTLAVLAQDAKRAVVYSHDRVDGPSGGEYRVSDLRVFDDGKVLYIEEGTKAMGGKPEHSSYEATLDPEDMRRLAEQLLERSEIRSLPRKVAPFARRACPPHVVITCLFSSTEEQ